MTTTIVNHGPLEDGTRWREIRDGDDTIAHEIGYGDREFEIRCMGGWWRVSGDFTHSRTDAALRSTRYDCTELKEALDFMAFSLAYERNRDAWRNWAVVLDRNLSSGFVMAVRKRSGSDDMVLSLRLSEVNPMPIEIVVRPADLEDCALVARLELVHDQFLDLLKDGKEIGGFISDLSAIHARPDRSTLVLALAEGPLDMRPEQLAPVEEQADRAASLPAAQRLIHAEHRACNSILHMALLGIADGSEINAVVGRDQDGDPFIERAWTDSVHDTLDMDLDGPRLLNRVPDGMLAHSGSLESSAALALAIEMADDDSRKAIDALASSAWNDVRLIAERLLDLDVPESIPDQVADEIDKAFERIRMQIPDGARFDEASTALAAGR